MKVKHFRYYPSLTSLFALIYNCVVSGSLQKNIFDYVRIRFFVVGRDYVREQLYSHVSFFFIIVTFLLLLSQLRYQCFCYNSTFVMVLKWLGNGLVCHCEILSIMWQLHFSRFLKNVFLITLEIRCLLVRSNYLRKYDTVTLRIGASFLGHQLFDNVDILMP